MSPALSVIICTYNPRLEYLNRTLDALKHQTLPQSDWELILIDNASETPVTEIVDLSWHSQARHVLEPALGLTPARLCGIRTAAATTLVFVDDDNVLDPQYLEHTLNISQNKPSMGAWGGQIAPEFEVPPPAWTTPYWSRLAIREFDRDRWANVPELDFCPWGAGLSVRKPVAQAYAKLVASDAKRLNFERKGDQLLGCGDIDLVYTACDLGLGIGLFVDLKLLHLIPPQRLESGYLLKLTQANSYSALLLAYIRNNGLPPKKSWQGKLLEYARSWRMTPRERQVYRAHKRGEALAYKQIQTWMALD